MGLHLYMYKSKTTNSDTINVTLIMIHFQPLPNNLHRIFKYHMGGWKQGISNVLKIFLYLFNAILWVFNSNEHVNN